MKTIHFKSQKLSFPLFALIAASFLLLTIVSILTYLNFNREKELLKHHLLRQGITIIRCLEAGARTGMMEMMWGESQVQTLFTETAKGPNIEQITLVDKDGRILMRSTPAPAGARLTGFRRPNRKDEAPFLILKNKNNENIFRVIKQFEPLKTEQNTMMNRMMGRRMQRKSGADKERYIALDLKMQEYQAAQKGDIRMGVILAVILLILGSASFYFLLIAQNYYVANRTLKTMESYTQNVVESMPNGLISLDKDGRIETINQKAQDLLGLNADEVKGKPLDEVMFRCNLPKTLLPREDIVERQMECHLNNGTVIPMSTTSSRLKDENGSSIGTVIILRDLRDIRSLEKEVQRSERLASLGRMAAGIAHEIRNPLSSIKGFAQYFRNKFPPDSEDRSYATVMTDEVDRLNRVIQDLLNFAGPQEPNLKPIDVLPLIRHALRLIQSDIREKKIQVVEDVPRNTDFTIAGDGDMLTQVFLNLFLNAIEAMPTGGRLKIALRRHQQAVEIEISDSGGGIPRENLTRIFDPFFTSKKGGTGLGLAIVYRIIENHQGEIKVESEPGKGSTFVLRFPLG
ncbi:sensor protein ZraS [bacterium BMS3Abin05]|nr:sensor protein ZraS [bacterium BMS3Abin05]GBE28130.1 sensor protein ZraS [bacterium BMS3Bbin03]HDZ13043.1 PAS domain S-box protein [Bacteroidota bacterium]